MPLLTKIADTYALTVVGPFGGCVRQARMMCAMRGQAKREAARQMVAQREAA